MDQHGATERMRYNALLHASYMLSYAPPYHMIGLTRIPQHAVQGWGEIETWGSCQYGMTPADSAEMESTMRFPVKNCSNKVIV